MMTLVKQSGGRGKVKEKEEGDRNQSEAQKVAEQEQRPGHKRRPGDGTGLEENPERQGESTGGRRD